eukprot:1659107-Prymnesium_polylepis.2
MGGREGGRASDAPVPGAAPLSCFRFTEDSPVSRQGARVPHFPHTRSRCRAQLTHSRKWPPRRLPSSAVSQHLDGSPPSLLLTANQHLEPSPSSSYTPSMLTRPTEVDKDGNVPGFELPAGSGTCEAGVDGLPG